MKNTFNFLLQYFGVKPAYTQTSQIERACLFRYAAGKKKLVEVGVFQGVTTRVLRQAMDPQGTLYGIDPFYSNRLGVCFYQVIANREVKSVSNGVVKWIKMTSTEALSSGLFNSHSALDFVFIDGDHSWEGIEGDWIGFSPLIRRGGIIALHDSRNSGGCGSELFTNKIILNDSRFCVVETVESLTVLERL
jgi:predicted O-methyltransferase YrrM